MCNVRLKIFVKEYCVDRSIVSMNTLIRQQLINNNKLFYFNMLREYYLTP